MTDREKLVELIAKIQDYGYKTVYEENAMYMHTITAEELADYLLAHGVTVKQMQKPLTVEELMKIPGSVWYENDIAIAPMMVSNQKSFSHLYLKDVVFGWYRSPCVDCFASIELPVSDYGKTWRCWKEKPSEAERKAAEWEK